MSANPTIGEKELRHYEGLVRKTAGRYVSLVVGQAMDFEDLCQILRIRVWKALESYDSAKFADQDRYVFMCIRNQIKDLAKSRSRHPEREALYIEDVAPAVNGNGVARDAFERRYLADDEESALSEVLDEPPDLPSSLSVEERKIVGLLYYGYRQIEVARHLEIPPRQVSDSIKRIRDKMEDWRPEPEVPTPVAA